MLTNHSDFFSSFLDSGVMSTYLSFARSASLVSASSGCQFWNLSNVIFFVISKHCSAIVRPTISVVSVLCSAPKNICVMYGKQAA